MKRITDTLQVTRSNHYTRGKEARKRYKPHPDDAKYLPLIRQITDKRPTYGYRRVTAFINRFLRGKEESTVNHKRIYRIMRVNHLLLPKYTGKPVKAS